MGPRLSQKCVAGLSPQSPPSKLMEKKHDCHNSWKKRVEGDPIQNLTFIIKTLTLL